jgi:hypothetical protein
MAHCLCRLATVGTRGGYIVLRWVSPVGRHDAGGPDRRAFPLSGGAGIASRTPSSPVRSIGLGRTPSSKLGAGAAGSTCERRPGDSLG